MEIQRFVLIGIIIAVAAALQSAVGFGFGLFSIPIFVWLGMSAPEAIALETGAVLCQTAWGVYQYRVDMDWAATWPLAPARALTIPLGVFALSILVGMGPDRIKQAIGAAVLLAVMLQWLGRVQPREHVARGWAVTAGLASGFLSGLAGMGGAPVVLWVMAHDWSTRRTRATLWAVFLQTFAIQMVLLWWQFGAKVPIAFLIGVACFPLAVLASSIGLRLGSLMSRHRLRAAAFGLLIVIALASIAGPIWHAT